MSQAGTKRPRPHAEDFALGWICALPIELTAAVAILDEEYDTSEDFHQYTLGRVGKHNVVISCLPAGHLGTGAAAAVATNMKAQFPALHIGLMVGVGGGVPSRDADIRLGDVVISVPQGDFGGVVQYDFGKILPGQQIRTGSLNSPPEILLIAVNKLRANINAGRSDIPKYLASIAHIQGFTRPHAGPDTLFCSCSRIEQSLCRQCCGGGIIKRSERQDEQLIIHYGTIASGNRVIKDALERDRINAELKGVLCFEMEAAGIMNCLPCLVIRGICDYSDSHKNKDWQPFAAATAAACAKEILSLVPGLLHRRLLSTHKLSTDSNACIRTDQPYGEQTSGSLPRTPILTPDQRKEYLDSLRFDKIENRHANIKIAHNKTCRWLLDKPEYRDWLDEDKFSQHHGLLWIKGNPGTGKSTIMKFAFANAVRNARKETSTPLVISFFFNARGEELEKSVLGMYRSLVLQLLEKAPELDVFDSARLTDLNESQQPQWNIEILKSLFQHSIESLRRPLTCFIDALDECDEDEIREMVAFFEELGDLAVDSQCKLRVCFSSRHYPSIIIQSGIKFILDDEEGHYQDIEKYVYSELKFKAGQDFDQIKREVINKASGIFLWAVLVVPILNKEYARGNMRQLKKRLLEIPKGLDELFKSILTRDNQDTEKLILCLQWVLFAKRPLRPEELYFAILVGTESEKPQQRDSEYDSDDAIERFILTASKGLAEMTKATKSKERTVQFIHESVRDFLLKQGGFSQISSDITSSNAAQSHECLKQCCLKYISADVSCFMDPNEPLPKASHTDATELRKRVIHSFPFLEYATRNILYHADEAECGITQETFIRTFHLAHWIMLDNVFEKHEVRRHTKNVSLLYLLAEKNMANLIRSINPSVSDYFKVEAERYGFPLLAALATRSDKVIQMFIEHHAKKQPSGRRYYGMSQEYLNGSKRESLGRNFSFSSKTPVLSYIAQSGNAPLFSCLLDLGYWPHDEKDDKGRTPLLLAAQHGYTDIVKLLLDSHADIESKDNDGRTPLSWAAYIYGSNTIKLLLNNNADIESKDDIGRTPLSRAVYYNCINTVKLLLDSHADIESQDNNGRTPLFRAAENGYTDIVKLLLDSRADIKSKDNNGRTPLSRAAENGHADIVKLLLDGNRGILQRVLSLAYSG
ncbi:hypothetical protein DTO271G3_2344 [Paecilomyces variotii]|nr:hypothetical protein DTO271G3_2344 [Paecilomyces variotii]